VSRCDVQSAGNIELYFYGELDATARASIEAHLQRCGECTHALEELRLIRDALATRPDVSAPESGDWSSFMARLDSSIRMERGTRTVETLAAPPPRPRYVSYLAMAALLTLVTASVTVALRSRHGEPAPSDSSVAHVPKVPPAISKVPPENPTADFEALSEEHFERSKLVVLGLATKDPADEHALDWAYERELASSLLDDTRMYRLAAEDRGLTNIAGVMRDLELVLLQTSMTDEKDPGALRRIQRVIQKRDLLEKMDAVAAPPAARSTGTKGI
jgi:putative zinc finger protein